MTEDFRPVKRKPKPVRESQVEDDFVARVKSLGGIAYKFSSMGRAAVPDRLVLFPGGTISFCELKRPGEVPTAAQSREHAFLRSLGFRVDVISTREDAKKWTP